MVKQPTIDEILEWCLDGIENQGLTAADCLARFENYRDELEPLLNIEGQFRAAHSVQPSEMFRQESFARLRTRLKPRSRRRTFGDWLASQLALLQGSRRFAFAMTALVAILILAGLTTSTIRAADTAKPGDSLYPVELAVENVQLGFSPPGRALGLRLRFAQKRLHAAEDLAQEGDDAHMQEALDNYHALIIDAQLEDAGIDAESLQQIETTLSVHQQRLQALLDKVPAAAHPGIERAIQASKHGQEVAGQKIKQHGGGKPSNTPGHGNKNKDCLDGTTLSGQQVGQSHRLANQYGVPYETVRDLFCAGLTADEIEQQLSTASPQTP